MRVRCGSVDCKWNSPTHLCMYQGTLKLNDCFYHTVNEGFKHFHECRMYEKDETIEQMEKEIVNFFKEKGL